MATGDDCGGEDGGCGASGSGVSGVGSVSSLDSLGRRRQGLRLPPSSTWLTLPALPSPSPVEGGGIAPGAVKDMSLTHV
jgi:hypothetical protein